MDEWMNECMNKWMKEFVEQCSKSDALGSLLPDTVRFDVQTYWYWLTLIGANHFNVTCHVS